MVLCDFTERNEVTQAIQRGARISRVARWPRRLGWRVAMTLIPVFMLTALEGAAAPFPEKPVRFILLRGVGGSVDRLGRLVAQKLNEEFGQQVVVDNRPGANGIIGAEIAAHSRPDGYTILLTSNADAINVSLYRKLPYDIEKDFAPVSLVASMPHVLSVHPTVPAGSVKEFIALAKSRPGSLNYAAVGIGSTPHLAAELFKSAAGVDIVTVNYKESGRAISDVVGGQVQLMFLGASSALPHGRSGRLKLLAVTSPERACALPDVPTIAEATGTRYQAVTWWGLAVPAGTPQPIIRKLNEALNRALDAPDMRERLSAEAMQTLAGTPQQYATYMKEEIARWRGVIRAGGIQPQ